jgi:transposase
MSKYKGSSKLEWERMEHALRSELWYPVQARLSNKVMNILRQRLDSSIYDYTMSGISRPIRFHLYTICGWGKDEWYRVKRGLRG